MSAHTRRQMLSLIGKDLPAEERALHRGLVSIVFDQVLGEDDGRPLTEEDHRAVERVMWEELKRMVAEAGFESIEAWVDQHEPVR